MKVGNKNIEQDLEDILKSVAKAENIRNYDLVLHINPTKGEGFLSEFFTGEILNKDTNKATSVAIKKAPASCILSIEKIYKNEINFYSKAFPQLDKFQKEKKVTHPFHHIPKYFSGSVDSENVFLAMGNLKADGYVLFDKTKFFDREHLELIFKTYGKFHALSFSFKQENVEAYEELVNNFSDITEASGIAGDLLAIMEKAYFGALDTFDPITEADILVKLKAVENIADTLRKVLSNKSRYKCLVHGDCWSNNMLFKYKESGELEDMKLIDFQVSYSKSPVFDLSYFFYSSASKTDMDKIDYYLDLYYESFTNFARQLGGDSEKIFPLNILKKEWKEYGVLGVFLGCQLWVVKLMDMSDITGILDQKDLSPDKHMDVLKERMSIIVNQAEFRERAKNICLHAVEYGVI